MSMPSSSASTHRVRISSIDALRGLVILLMLVDHTREFFYLHVQVSDPMNLATTPPGLFFTRLAAHLCAPVFILLTGLAAFLYAERRGGARAASEFLLKRGLFLVVLEWTVINFAWSFAFPPPTFFLQVIWVIGLSMIALAGLAHLPRGVLLGLGLVITLGHNLLDPISFAPGEPGHGVWAVLHDRGYLELPWGGRARTSYPLLPWIGVISLGYALGPWFTRGVDAAWRRRRLLLTGAAGVGLFLVLRLLNVYGETRPWRPGDTGLATVMSFLNLTKYPPSADFLALTLGAGVLLLALLERAPAAFTRVLATYGSAPLFFYILHLYLLHALSRGVSAAGGHGESLARLPGVASLWGVAALVAVPCGFACRAFADLKRRSDAAWLRYL